MATDTELAVDRCPVCGHREVSRTARLTGGLIAGLICLVAVIGLIDLLVAVVSYL